MKGTGWRESSHSVPGIIKKLRTVQVLEINSFLSIKQLELNCYSVITGAELVVIVIVMSLCRRFWKGFWSFCQENIKGTWKLVDPACDLGKMLP